MIGKKKIKKTKEKSKNHRKNRKISRKIGKSGVHGKSKEFMKNLEKIKENQENFKFSENRKNYWKMNPWKNSRRMEKIHGKLKKKHTKSKKNHGTSKKITENRKKILNFGKKVYQNRPPAPLWTIFFMFKYQEFDKIVTVVKCIPRSKLPDYSKISEQEMVEFVNTERNQKKCLKKKIVNQYISSKKKKSN